MPRHRVRVDVKDLLEEAYARFATPDFIQDDPDPGPTVLCRPQGCRGHRLPDRHHRLGPASHVITNAFRLARMLDDRPASFIRDASEAELDHLDRFVHRTFQGVDLRYFVKALRHLVKEHEGLEGPSWNRDGSAMPARPSPGSRTASSPWSILHGPGSMWPIRRGSNAKRINMFLRWMVRPTTAVWTWGSGSGSRRVRAHGATGRAHRARGARPGPAEARTG